VRPNKLGGSSSIGAGDMAGCVNGWPDMMREEENHMSVRRKRDLA
jgi:hypothetical protein